MKINLYRSLFSAAMLLLGLGFSARAAEPTAYELIKAGNDYVSKDARDQVVQIRSEKSLNGLTPNIWYIVYYDPDASLKATEVKFGSGKKMDVKRPFRLLEPVTGADKKLDRKKMNVDSDKAIKIATAEPLLEKLTLRATQLWLEHGDDGPVWKVRIWAQKLRHPTDDADIGEVFVSAGDGKVVKVDLHPNRID